MIMFLQLDDIGPALEWAKTLGVGGILAAGMFLFYRRDRLQAEKNQQDCEARYAELSATLLGEFRTIVEENTAAMIRLSEMIERRPEHGK